MCAYLINNYCCQFAITTISARRMSVAALVLGHTGSVRGLKGGVQKLLAELKEKNERMDESPVLQRLREVAS